MTSTVMRNTIDAILKIDFNMPSVIYEIIGGEPFMEIGLIKEMTEYIIRRQLELNHPWKDNYVFSFVTNGTLFTDEVKEYLLFDKARKSVSLSLDGVKELQDANRSNSFDTVMENINWWKQNFPNNIVKSTLNHDSIPYIYDSVKFFVDELKLPIVMMNTVFENVWQENDDKLFYDQLIKVADFLLEDNRYKKHTVSLFSEGVLELTPPNFTKCGCGNTMMYADSKGKFYPCIRFKYTDKCDSYIVGTTSSGIDYNKVLPFEYYHNFKDEECRNCKYESSCQNCPGFDYDQTGTIFGRTKYNCKMHLARCKANEYFFSKVKEMEN
jgi:radical SAM peptide maturase (CXXX-repeat target family)